MPSYSLLYFLDLFFLLFDFFVITFRSFFHPSYGFLDFVEKVDLEFGFFFAANFEKLDNFVLHLYFLSEQIPLSLELIRIGVSRCISFSQ